MMLMNMFKRPKHFTIKTFQTIIKSLRIFIETRDYYTNTHFVILMKINEFFGFLFLMFSVSKEHLNQYMGYRKKPVY